METLNERIKQLRKDKGWTQGQLAEQLGVTDKAVSKWEVGEANPDISLLVKMAQLFGVTVDYLLTGVAPEKEVIIKSPKEMLLETDDVSYLEKISPSDLNIVEMYEYKLANTFAYLVDNNKIRNYMNGKRRSSQHSLDVYIPEILFLSIISNRLQKLKIFDFNDIGFAEDKELTDEMLEALASDERVTDETRDYVLSIHCRQLISVNQGDARNSDRNHNYGNWQSIYPRVLDKFALAKKWDWVEKILRMFETLNAPGVERYIREVKNNPNTWGSNKPFLAFTAPTYEQTMFGGYNGIRVIRILNSTLKTLLKEHQYELLKLANLINGQLDQFTISAKEIEEEQIESDDSLSEIEKFKKKCINHYIIQKELLLTSNDVELIKSIVKEGYYNYYELAYDWILKGKLSDLFKFYVDNGYDVLANLLLLAKDGDFKELLTKSFLAFSVREDMVGQEFSYSEHKDFINNQNHLPLGESGSEQRNREKGIETERSKFIKEHEGKPEEFAGLIENNPIIQMIKARKEAWITYVENRIEEARIKQERIDERKKVAKRLSRKYLQGLLDNGSPENVKLFKLELCTLLDTIFVYDFQYSGEDFASRMNQHFEMLENNLPKEREMDDGWGYMVPDTKYTEEVVKPERARVSRLRNLFYRLRVERNNILHPQKNEIDELNISELRECLEYVFSINKMPEE